ncbi:hypothetical protein VTK26DRAFT_2335 [Humicola hyalothermophila]
MASLALPYFPGMSTAIARAGGPRRSTPLSQPQIPNAKHLAPSLCQHLRSQAAMPISSGSSPRVSEKTTTAGSRNRQRPSRPDNVLLSASNSRSLRSFHPLMPTRLRSTLLASYENGRDTVPSTSLRTGDENSRAL